MLRLPKLTDYAVVILTAMAELPDQVQTTNGLAQRTGLPLPTVAKVLKQLTKNGILSALRGTHGGYRLGRAPTAITVADIVVALDGPVAVTDCVDSQKGHCHVESRCAMRGQWDAINRAIKSALEAVTLADMLKTQKTAWIEPEQPQQPAQATA